MSASLTVIGQGSRRILALPGLFATAESLRPVFAQLKDCTVLVPVYSGYAGSGRAYVNEEDEAALILQALQETGQSGPLDLLYGISFGANIGAYLVKEHSDLFRKVLFDTPMYFKVNGVLLKGLQKALHSGVQAIRGYAQEEDAEKALLENSYFQKYLGNPNEANRALYQEIVRTMRSMDEASAERMLTAAASFAYPHWNPEQQKQVIFLFSPDDPVQHVEKHVREHYPDARYSQVKGFGYCGFLTQEPKAYAGMVSSLL
jgi:pimeloyl-ACP methyl ester carboxylesterase